MNITQKNITILGSTGSIGTQTLDVIQSHPDMFRVSVLTAGHNWRLLRDQALRFNPQLVVIADESKYPLLKESLIGTGIEVAAGSNAVTEAASMLDDDIIVGAMVGYSGLIPTLSAIKKGKTIALANKETLVAGGKIVKDACRASGAKILPVDSEHSAIFQCLQGENHHDISKLILTASGGPFLNRTQNEFDLITPEDALKHPNWNMGAKVTIDSATMMNKGFEMIEAHWLFDIEPENIEVLVHPQSVIHSMVEFTDGSIKAQLGIPDMRTPIRYALGYRGRLKSNLPRLDFSQYKSLTFMTPDFNKFPLLKVAYEVMKTGGSAPVVLNAANEVAVEAFLNRKLKFNQIPNLILNTLSKIPYSDINSPEDIADVHNKAIESAKNTLY